MRALGEAPRLTLKGAIGIGQLSGSRFVFSV